MKTFFKSISRWVNLRSPQPPVFNHHKKTGVTGFDPAPAYWAMIPVKVTTTRHQRSGGPGE